MLDFTGSRLHNVAIRKMAGEARRLGYEYIAIADHSKRLTMVNSLDAKRLRQQIAEIDRLLEDGKLDLPDEVLNELDLTVCSIHSKFELSRKQQTERVLRAMDNPRFNILGHPAG